MGSKDTILTILRQQQGHYISGEELSKRLQLSRTAVWKHIHRLREEGYQIEAQPNLGYCLQFVPDQLTAAELKNGLSTNCFGQVVHYFATVDSTNNVAKELAGNGAEEGTIVVAEEQQAGKGRRGRSWYSPAGTGISLSIILRPRLEPQDAPKFTLVAAVATARAITAATGVNAQIKWPNDLLINGRKCVGILTEMNAEIGCINYLVIGIGINVNLDASQLPPELQGQVTSLMSAAGRRISRVSLVQHLLSELEILYQQLQNGGFPAILDEWRSLTGMLGRQVRVTTLNEVIEGTVMDVNADGALILCRADGSLQTIMAGDVSVRGINGTYALF